MKKISRETDLHTSPVNKLLKSYFPNDFKRSDRIWCIINKINEKVFTSLGVVKAIEFVNIANVESLQVYEKLL